MRCDFPHIELLDETSFNPDYRRRRLVKSIESFCERPGTRELLFQKRLVRVGAKVYSSCFELACSCAFSLLFGSTLPHRVWVSGHARELLFRTSHCFLQRQGMSHVFLPC